MIRLHEKQNCSFELVNKKKKIFFCVLFITKPGFKIFTLISDRKAKSSVKTNFLSSDFSRHQSLTFSSCISRDRNLVLL